MPSELECLADAVPVNPVLRRPVTSFHVLLPASRKDAPQSLRPSRAVSVEFKSNCIRRLGAAPNHFWLRYPHGLTAWAPSASYRLKHAMAARTTLNAFAIRRQIPCCHVVPVAADQHCTANMTMVIAHPDGRGTGNGLPSKVRRMAWSAPMARRRAVSMTDQISA